MTLGVSVPGHGKAKLVLPMLSRLVPDTGNRNKLTIALALLRVLAPVRLLCDSWFMRARLVLPLCERSLTLHGKPQKLRLRSAVALARFLKDAPVRAVWCEFYDDRKQTWEKPRLAAGHRNGVIGLGHSRTVVLAVGASIPCFII